MRNRPTLWWPFSEKNNSRTALRRSSPTRKVLQRRCWQQGLDQNFDEVESWQCQKTHSTENQVVVIKASKVDFRSDFSFRAVVWCWDLVCNPVVGESWICEHATQQHRSDVLFSGCFVCRILPSACQVFVCSAIVLCNCLLRAGLQVLRPRTLKTSDSFVH